MAESKINSPRFIDIKSYGLIPSENVTVISNILRRKNDVVEINAILQKTVTQNQWNELATIPTAFKDSSTRNLIFANSTNGMPIAGKITNGVISVWPKGTSDLINVSIDVTYLIE